MSKAKQTNPLKKKEKLTSFDIMYKVVTIVLAVVMFPLCYFTTMIYVQMDHTQIADLWGSITQNQSPELGVTYEEVSIAKLPEYIELFSGFSNSDTPVNIWSLEHLRPAIIAGGFLVLALVLGLVIIGFAIFSKQIKTIVGLSAGGFISTIISLAIFNEAFAKPIINGSVSISELFNINNSLATLALSYIGKITAISPREAFFSVMFIMLGICLWSLCILLVNSSEQPQKVKKAKNKSLK